MRHPTEQALKEWRENPCRFVHDHFGVTPDKWQEQALNVFPSMDPDKIRISLEACAGPGKSTAMTWMGWNFLSCYAEPGEHPKGAAMSVTADNLKDNMWAEFSKWQGRSEYLSKLFTHTSERIFQNQYPKTWFLSARSFPKTANADEQGRTLSGLHSKFILYLIDESGDISPNVLNAAEQGLATGPKFGKIIQSGNPTSLTGMLYKASKDPKWHRIKITGDPDDPNRSPRIDIEWARAQIKEHGRDNPWVMAYILGLFPPGGINTLIPHDLAANAIGRHLPEDAYMYSQKRLGIDVARFGDDRTVIWPRQGLASFKPVIMRAARTNEIADRVELAKVNWNSDLEFVDGTGGWGAGVVDHLITKKRTPIEVNFAGKATDNRYFNKRAEMWFGILNWLKRGGALPKVDGLLQELTAPTYSIVGGRFQLESKEQIKKRLGFSPDIGDALGLTFATPDAPAVFKLPGGLSLTQGGHGVHVVQDDYNPYDTSRL